MTQINLPQTIKEALEGGAPLICSISGGKDSDAMLKALTRAYQVNGWSGRRVTLHCNLGRMDWHGTAEHCRALAVANGWGFVEVEHSAYDLIAGIWARWERIQASDKPGRCPWPDARNRYCTSDWKRTPTDKWIRANFDTDQPIIVAMGLRAEESPARAKKPVFEARSSVSTKTRTAYNWHPIHDWPEVEVWDEIGYSLNRLTHLRSLTRILRERGNPNQWILNYIKRQFPAHYAYALGNQRLSCSMCILAGQNDLLNGAEHNPDVYRELCRIEAVTGYSFKNKIWLSDLRPDLLPESTLAAVARHKATVA